MKLHLRLLCCVAILLTAAMVSAANVVPGIEVVVLKGSFSVFRGVTDGRGRFETGPLQPGVYTIEVRTVANTPPTSARFFLSLAGAKPLGDATIRPGVALAMNAMVRNPAGIRGQVSARGGIVYVPRTASNAQPAANTANTPPPQNPPPAPKFGQIAKPAPSPRPVAANPPAVSARNQTSARTVAAPTPAAPVAGPESGLVRRPVGYQPRIINGRRYFWVPITPGANLGRWMAESVARPVRTAPPTSSPPPTAPSPTPSRNRR